MNKDTKQTRRRRSPLKVPVKLAIVLVVFIFSIAMLISLMNLTSPDEAGPLGVTSAFILLYVAILATLTVIKMLMLRTTKVTLDRLVGLALIPTIILAMRSLRQLTIVDVSLIVLFALLVNFYIHRASKEFN